MVYDVFHRPQGIKTKALQEEVKKTKLHSYTQIKCMHIVLRKIPWDPIFDSVKLESEYLEISYLWNEHPD